MKANGLARLGRDAELRHLNNGDAVVNLALAFSYGKKGEDGSRPTQWLDAAMFGKRAETLAQYLTKGSMINVYVSDVHIETYEGRQGSGHKLVARVDDIELVPNGNKQDQQSASQRPAPQPARQAPPPRPASGVSHANTFDDQDIPF